MNRREIVERWTAEYMAVVKAGWASFPTEMKDSVSAEDKAAIVRGMMVDAGKCGIIPGADSVIKMMDEEAAAWPKTTAPPKDPKPIKDNLDLGDLTPPAKSNGITKAVDAKLVAPAEQPQAKEFDVGPAQLANWKENAYDREHLTWLGCPNDPKHTIEEVILRDHKTSKITGKTQKCATCQLWLNSDGRKNPMKEMKK